MSWLSNTWNKVTNFLTKPLGSSTGTASVLNSTSPYSQTTSTPYIQQIGNTGITYRPPTLAESISGLGNVQQQATQNLQNIISQPAGLNYTPNSQLPGGGFTPTNNQLYTPNSQLPGGYPTTQTTQPAFSFNFNDTSQYRAAINPTTGQQVVYAQGLAGQGGASTNPYTQANFDSGFSGTTPVVSGLPGRSMFTGLTTASGSGLGTSSVGLAQSILDNQKQKKTQNVNNMGGGSVGGTGNQQNDPAIYGNQQQVGNGQPSSQIKPLPIYSPDRLKASPLGDILNTYQSRIPGGNISQADLSALASGDPEQLNTFLNNLKANLLDQQKALSGMPADQQISPSDNLLIQSSPPERQQEVSDNLANTTLQQKDEIYAKYGISDLMKGMKDMQDRIMTETTAYDQMEKSINNDPDFPKALAARKLAVIAEARDKNVKALELQYQFLSDSFTQSLNLAKDELGLYDQAKRDQQDQSQQDITNSNNNMSKLTSLINSGAFADATPIDLRQWADATGLSTSQIQNMIKQQTSTPDELLTPAEAKSLGVAYGTTRTQAYGKMPVKDTTDTTDKGLSSQQKANLRNESLQTLLKSKVGGQNVDGNEFARVRAEYVNLELGSSTEFNSSYGYLLSNSDKTKFGIY